MIIKHLTPKQAAELMKQGYTVYRLYENNEIIFKVVKNEM